MKNETNVFIICLTIFTILILDNNNGVDLIDALIKSIGGWDGRKY